MRVTIRGGEWVRILYRIYKKGGGEEIVKLKEIKMDYSRFPATTKINSLKWELKG